MNFTNVTTPSSRGSGCEGGSSDAARGDFWLGIMSSIIGSITLNLGINVQKLAFVRLARIPAETRGKIYCYPLWILGFAIFLVGNAGDAVGLTFTAQSIITPLGSVSLVSNLLFAWLLVGEKLDKATVGATVLIILGVVAIVLSSNASCSSYTIDLLMDRFRQAPFLIFSFFHISVLVGLWWYTHKMEKKMTGPEGLFRLTLRERFNLRLAYPIVASLFAAWTVLLVKGFGELLKVSFRSGSTQFLRIETWLITFGFVLSTPLQIVYIQKGLAHFEAMYVVPIFSSCWSIGSISMGALFWGEFAEFEAWQFVIFFCGVLLVMVGIVLLQQRTMDAEGSAKVHPSTDLESMVETNEVAATGLAASSFNGESKILDSSLLKSNGLRQSTSAQMATAPPVSAKIGDGGGSSHSIGKITRGASFFTRAAGSLAVAKGMGTRSLVVLRVEEEGRMRNALAQRLESAPPGRSLADSGDGPQRATALSNSHSASALITPVKKRPTMGPSPPPWSGGGGGEEDLRAKLARRLPPRQ